jgi:hypothetical protein
MTDKARRRELRTGYQATDRGAGVYLVHLPGPSRSLLGSTNDLTALHNRLSFAQSTGSPNALDLRLRADLQRYGMADVTIEVLDTLTVTQGMTAQEVKDDLAALEALWRDKLDDSTLY